MSDDDAVLSPAAFQAKIAEMQVNFQRQIAELQAAGDYAGIGTASAQYQSEVTALTNKFQAAMANLNSDHIGALVVDEYDAVPKDDQCAQLMLLGAMYVEENNMLMHMRNLYPTDKLNADRSTILTEFFSSLDMNMEGVDVVETRDLLADSWGIENIESLKNTLGWLLKEGHNKNIMQLINYANSRPEQGSRSLEDFRQCYDQPLAYDDYSEKDFSNILLVARSFQAKLPAAGIWAWDVARYVHLLRLGYMAAYMKSDECWVYLRRLLEPVSKNFSSWREYVQSYTQGFRWWSDTSGPIEDACHRLLEDPQSPWLYFGWFTPPSQIH